MSAVSAPRGASLEASLLAAFAGICSQCGENVVSGMIYALLGVSAMARVSLGDFCFTGFLLWLVSRVSNEQQRPNLVSSCNN